MKKILFFLCIPLLGACTNNSASEQTEAQADSAMSTESTLTADSTTVIDKLGATTLNIRDVAGDIKVVPQKIGLNYITIVITGPDSLRKKYTAKLSGKTVTFMGTGKTQNGKIKVTTTSDKGSNTVVIGEGSTLNNSHIIQSNGDETSVDGKISSTDNTGGTITFGTASAIRIEFRIPKQTTLHFSNVTGNVDSSALIGAE